MLTSSILIFLDRTDLKYEMAIHNYISKAEFEKCFGNNSLLHQQNNVIPDIIDVVLPMKKIEACKIK